MDLLQMKNISKYYDENKGVFIIDDFDMLSREKNEEQDIILRQHKLQWQSYVYINWDS